MLRSLKHNDNILKIGLYYCAYLAAFLLLGLHLFALPGITQASVQRLSDGMAKPLSLPDLGYHQHGAFGYVFHLDYGGLSQPILMLHPEGCITLMKLNDKDIPIDPNGHCDNLETGLRLDLTPYLVTGENELLLQVTARGVQLGPVIFDSAERHLSDWLGYGLVGVAIAALMILSRMFLGDWPSGGILSAGLLVYLYRFSVTGYLQTTHDLFGHLEYIDYIVRHWALPDAYMNFSSYHPPLYYVTEALLLAFFNKLGSFDTLSALRLFSLGCFMASLWFMTLTLKRLVKNPLAYYTSLVLLVFYPCGLIFSSGIESDLLFYSFFSACLYFGLLWLEEFRFRDLGLALVMFGLGIATRSNMLILLPLFAAAALYNGKKHGLDPRPHLRARQVQIGLAVVVAGLLLNYGRTIVFQLTHHSDASLIVGSAKHLWDIAVGLRITNTPEDFLTMNMTGYLKQPFWNVWWDNSDRPFFWNSLFKSSITGEFHWSHGPLAHVLDVLLLALVAYIVVGAVVRYSSGNARRRILFLALALGVPVAALALNRILNPVSCSQDFRYIYPCLVGFTGLFGMAIDHYMQKRSYVLAGAGVLLGIVFSGYSVVFFLSQ